MNKETTQKIETLRQDFKDKKITHIQFVDGMANIHQESSSVREKTKMPTRLERVEIRNDKNKEKVLVQELENK